MNDQHGPNKNKNTGKMASGTALNQKAKRNPNDDQKRIPGP